MNDRERLLRAIEEVRQRAEMMSPKPVPRVPSRAAPDEVNVRAGVRRRFWAALVVLGLVASIGAIYLASG